MEKLNDSLSQQLWKEVEELCGEFVNRLDGDFHWQILEANRGIEVATQMIGSAFAVVSAHQTATGLRKATHQGFGENDSCVSPDVPPLNHFSLLSQP